jgi:hypothetical protein
MLLPCLLFSCQSHSRHFLTHEFTQLSAAGCAAQLMPNSSPLTAANSTRALEGLDLRMEHAPSRLAYLGSIRLHGLPSLKRSLCYWLHARAAAPASNQKIRVIVDCPNIVDTANAIITAIKDDTLSAYEYPCWGYGRWQYIAQSMDTPSIDTLERIWLPSHGKNANWAPPDDIHGDAQTYRKLNGLADTAAKEGAAYAEVILGIEPFNQRCIRAQERAESALIRLSLAVHRYLEDNAQLHTKCAQLDAITLAP